MITAVGSRYLWWRW